MLKILTQTPKQSCNEVLLVVESVGTSESFEDLREYFGFIAKDIRAIESGGIQVIRGAVKVIFNFVGDFKVIYALTGSPGASGTYSCVTISLLFSLKLVLYLNITCTYKIHT